MKTSRWFKLDLLQEKGDHSISHIQERSFQRQYDQNQLIFVRVGLAIALVSYALYALSDNLAAPSSETTLFWYRFGVICPVLGSLLLLTWYPPYASLGQKVYTFQMTIMGYLHLILLALLDPSDPGFNSYYGGLILIVCGLGILGGLRTRYSAITAFLIFAGYQFVAVFLQDMLSTRASTGTFVINSLFLITAVSFSVLTSYLLETYGRRNFMQSSILKAAVETMKMSEKKLKSTLHEQAEWSSLFTRFIRHELGNSVTGASTSLQLIARKSQEDDTLVYVSRAQRCLKELRELLYKASEATSIDDAFQFSEHETVDLHELIEELVATYNQSNHNPSGPNPSNHYPSNNGQPNDNEQNNTLDQNQNIIALKINSQFQVKGSYMLLNQLFKNLIDNALRHSEPDKSVDITLTKDREVLIENIGDPLPEDIESLFDLGQTSQSSKSGLFGLGLYVVKKIALAHQAEVKAEPLNKVAKPKPSGARFIVKFPN